MQTGAVAPIPALKTPPGLSLAKALDDLERQANEAVPAGATLAVENYVCALSRRLLKIMSKMGISTLRGYRGPRIFEAVGLGPELMEK